MTISKTTTDLSTLKINYLTQEMYEDALENDEINENELYVTPGGEGGGGAIDATSIPTANKVAKFDTEARMNSEDMSSTEINNFVGNLGYTFNLIDMFYPVGSYYETSDSTFNPNITWGGTWVLETSGQVHVSAGENYEVGDTGGAETQSYPLGVNGGAAVRKYSTTFYFGNATTFEMPKAVGGSNQGYWVTSANSDSFSTAAPPTTPFGGVRLYGNTESGNNMQPYIVVNRWHRTA